MELKLNRISRYSLTLINTVFSMVNIDYKALSQYIIGFNQKNDLESILVEAAKCLKHILRYRLFAFAVQNDDMLEVWVDPSVYQKSFARMIEKDFDAVGKLNIHPINECEDTGQKPRDIRSTDMLAYTVNNAHCVIKLYLIPERKMFSYHNDILTIILNTLGVAVSNFIQLKRLENEATIDALTQCYNRRELNRLIELHVSNARRYGKDLSVIMFDLDHFKQINDDYGHQAGDEVLKHIAETIRFKIRKGDYLARYGGEEFIIVLPDTAISKATDMAERIRKSVEHTETITADAIVIRATASFGVASLAEDSSEHCLLAAVDAMLYKAKHNGRNTIASAWQPA